MTAPVTIHRQRQALDIRSRLSLRTVLRDHPAWRNHLVWDEMTHCPRILKPAPWDELCDTSDEGLWIDHFTTRAHLWLEDADGLVGMPTTERLQEGIHEVARLTPYHPVRAYLLGLPEWDGVPRIQGGSGSDWPLFYRYFGADQSVVAREAEEHQYLTYDYVRSVGIKMLVGAVARVMPPRTCDGKGGPGCKVDTMPILEGKEGAGKQRWLTDGLLPDPAWYMGSDIPIGERDAYVVIHGRWWVEIAEMHSFNRSHIDAVKAFLSNPADIYVGKWERYSKRVPRQCAIYGSTNRILMEYLEPGENRRFWPIVVGDIDVDALRRDRDQIWAEAVHLYQAGTPWWTTAEERSDLFRPQLVARERQSLHAEEVYQWLDGRKAITVTEVLRDCLHIERQYWRGKEADIHAVLHTAGFRPGYRRRIGDQTVSEWRRP